MDEEDTTTDDAIASRLSDEIQKLQQELDGTAKPLRLENGAFTTKGKQCLEVDVLGIQRSLRDKVMERECFLEEKRVVACVAKAEELEIIVIPESIDCPICLEEILKKERAALSCCGKLTCNGCKTIILEKLLIAIMTGDKAEARQLSICPCCRAALPDTEE